MTRSTIDLLAPEGVQWVADWINDDMPFALAGKGGAMTAMPLGFEISDLQIFHAYKYKAKQYVEQVKDHFDLLYREAGKHGGRIVTLPLRPWLSGVPHRIQAIEDALDHMLSHAGVWSATGAEILAAWKAQQ